MCDITQLKHYKAMWCNGHKVHIKNMDEKRKSFNNGIFKIFRVTDVSSRSDTHPEVSRNRYWCLEDIIEFDCKSFKTIFLDVKWKNLQMKECDLERTFFEHANVFTMVNIRNIDIPCDFGSSNGSFNSQPSPTHLTLNTQIPNLFTIN